MAHDPGENGARPKALRDYALITDGERGVLVGPRGGHVWMCFPHWDSPPAFAALLGGPGAHLVQPCPAGSCGAATTRTAASSGAAAG